MNYIGSKYSLRDFIDNTIKKVVGDNPSDMVYSAISLQVRVS